MGIGAADTSWLTHYIVIPAGTVSAPQPVVAAAVQHAGMPAIWVAGGALGALLQHRQLSRVPHGSRSTERRRRCVSPPRGVLCGPIRLTWSSHAVPPSVIPTRGDHARTGAVRPTVIDSTRLFIVSLWYFTRYRVTSVYTLVVILTSAQLAKSTRCCLAVFCPFSAFSPVSIRLWYYLTFIF